MLQLVQNECQKNLKCLALHQLCSSYEFGAVHYGGHFSFTDFGYMSQYSDFQMKISNFLCHAAAALLRVRTQIHLR